MKQINSKIDILDIIINANVVFEIVPELLVSTINHLTSIFFFDKTTTYIDSNNAEKASRFHENTLPLTGTYMLCVNVHDSMLVINKEFFDKELPYVKPNMVISKYEDIQKTDSFIVPYITVNPVYVQLCANPKCYVAIRWNALALFIDSNSYKIERNVFDMLYAESEDFNPTSDTSCNITIHSQARHQILQAGIFIVDMLHSDISIICDTQDKLINEHNNIYNGK